MGKDGSVEKFQVDLHGIVEILSRHLYSSPRVFVRELLQNGVDAITARRQVDPSHRGQITIAAKPDGTVTFSDDGIGLTAEEVRELLATIGRSSKRDELDMQRAGFLGQFGIGLLSCFLVSETIEVRTRSARTTDAPTVLWTGHGDGTYEITEAETSLTEPGTVVTLRPRYDEHWLRSDTVLDLATHYGALLPMPIGFIDPAGLRRQIAPQLAPWEMGPEAASRYCADTFGFEPLATIPLSVPVAGVSGVAFVKPTAASAAEESKHRVYLRRMLLGEAVSGLVPDWASFARVVVDVEQLRPTASREALYHDELLTATRREVGAQLRSWMVRTHAADPQLLEHFIRVHHAGVVAAALVDDDVLQVARDWLQWETTTGHATMSEILRAGRLVRYCGSIKDYEALIAVAAARGIRVVNAGYYNGNALLRRFAQADGSIMLRSTILSDLINDDESIDTAMQEVVQVGAHALRPVSCEVSGRSFEPRSSPALYVADPERAAMARDANRRAAVASDPVLGNLLDLLDDEEDEDVYPFDTLVINSLNPLIERMPAWPDDVRADVFRQLYVMARFAAGARVSDAERELLTDSMISLIERKH